MLSFLRRNQVLFSAFLSVLVSLYIIAPAAKGQHRADPIGPLLIAVMRPLQSAIQSTVFGVRDFFGGYVAPRGVAAGDERAKTRPGERMEFRTEWAPKAVTATVIANSASAYFHTLIIDKGRANGVEKGMAVISPLGVIGQVVSVTGRNAKVLLVTDSHSGVDAMVQRSRARGLVSGSLDNGTVMKYVKRSDDLKEGDRLVTSGLDGVFPKGLLIGTVSKVNKKNLGLFQYIEVGLALDPGRVEEVLVVRGNTPEIKD